MTNHLRQDEFDPPKFFRQLIRPQPFLSDQLLANRNQVAGHAGFYSSREELKHCLKPFNTKCVRGRREHLFYQLMEYFKTKSSKEPPDIYGNDNVDTLKIYYRYFTLLSYPSPPSKCNCVIDEEVFNLLSPFVAKFYHVRHLFKSSEDGLIVESLNEDNMYPDPVYSGCLECPCYGRNPKHKSTCSRDYEKVDFLCLEDLTAHCQRPCIIDIKIGQVTYDPMAIKEKVIEESSKYRRLREFGFRILGMKLEDEMKDKCFGKSLETTEQIREALDSFFGPLQENNFKSAALSQILNRLDDLMNWFENKNINQLQFFSSSLLIVYDSHIPNELELVEKGQDAVSESVRVNMIDFAHVFHVHDPVIDEGTCGVLDNNYIFGLKKLRDFFSYLNQRYQ